MGKAIIFGASQGGQNCYKYYTKRFPELEVLAFSDNDKAKQGTKLFGLPVISPDAIPAMEFDTVFIGSLYINEIWQQLTDLGVPPEKIDFVPQSVLNGIKKPVGCYVTLAILLAVAAYVLIF